MADTRRIRFRVEWVEERPADPEPGESIAVPFRELVVREVAPSFEGAQAVLAESRKLGTPLRFPHLGHASAEDLDGADALARLAPDLIEPGATWRAGAHVSMYGWSDRHSGGQDRRAATLGEALDAFPGWAEEWIQHARDFSSYNVELTGTAELAVVEPGDSGRGRVVLRVFFGNRERPIYPARNPEHIIDVLEGLEAEAERLYGDTRADLIP